MLDIIPAEHGAVHLRIQADLHQDQLFSDGCQACLDDLLISIQCQAVDLRVSG